MAADLTNAHRALINILAAEAVEQFFSETKNLQLIEDVTLHTKRPHLGSSRDNQERPKKGTNRNAYCTPASCEIKAFKH